jgi:hypothetical protein
MVAEINATSPDGTDIPPAEVATNAVAFAVTGKRNIVNVTSRQDGSTATTAPSASQERQHWGKVAWGSRGRPAANRWRAPRLMQVQDWSF